MSLTPRQKIWLAISVFIVLFDLALIKIFDSSELYKSLTHREYDLAPTGYIIFIFLPILGITLLYWIIWFAREKFWTNFWLAIVISILIALFAIYQ